MDGNDDGPAFMLLLLLVVVVAVAESSLSESECGLFRCWFVDALRGKDDDFDDDADTGTTAFDLNDASMDAKSLIFRQ
jgi:hypothetical protein